MLGPLLIVAGLAYVVDTVAHSLLSTYGDYQMLFLVIVAVPSIVAEGWFALLLLLRAGKHVVLPTADSVEEPAKALATR